MVIIRNVVHLTITQSRFGSFVPDRVLGLPWLLRYTWRYPCFSVVLPRAINKQGWGPLKGTASAQKALQGSNDFPHLTHYDSPLVSSQFLNIKKLFHFSDQTLDGDVHPSLLTAVWLPLQPPTPPRRLRPSLGADGAGRNSPGECDTQHSTAPNLR